ncbi:MAG: hypothetical protein M1834_006878 [Cirrosporium novae-zelandiae]|nr:MAG: hypothetical protein M1834_006878 [Cirrosporium novae-zelandiae]
MTEEVDRRWESSPSATARPYRSHRIPACDFCRHRKSRCTQDAAHGSCMLCMLHGVECSRDGVQRSRTNPPASSPRGRAPRQPKRQRTASPNRRDVAPIIDISSPHSGLEVVRQASIQSGSAHSGPESQALPPQSAHIIGPAIARDVQVLERYMSPKYNLAESHVRPNPYNVYSDDPTDPVVYMKVPRQRVVLPSGNGSPAFKQLEILDKVFEPHSEELFSVYLERIHPSFPVLDVKTASEAYRHNGLPNALVCEIYAVSLISWNTSAKLVASGRSRPDVRFIWNLTVSALHEDFLTPSLSTILASILDLMGRPITSITYNAVNLGRTVALSHSLGLNRNPSTWRLDQRQIGLRIRTWWAILIHDRWASLAHGTPPHIHREQYDVPLPGLDILVEKPSEDTVETGSQDRRRGAHCFIALCQLTEILGEVLHLMYNLQIPNGTARLKSIRRFETHLDEWEDSLPSWLNPIESDFDRLAPGARSLQLSFYALKMCLSRAALHEFTRSGEADDIAARLYHQSRCQKAARVVVDFVVSLQADDLDVFWLPYSAYHFTSATTLTLRCALEAENDDTARECITNAKDLINRLRSAKDNQGWDLAEICLAQCEAVVNQMWDGGLPSKKLNGSSYRQSQSQSRQLGNSGGRGSVDGNLREASCHTHVVNGGSNGNSTTRQMSFSPDIIHTHTRRQHPHPHHPEATPTQPAPDETVLSMMNATIPPPSNNNNNNTSTFDMTGSSNDTRLFGGTAGANNNNNNNNNIATLSESFPNLWDTFSLDRYGTF